MTSLFTLEHVQVLESGLCIMFSQPHTLPNKVSLLLSLLINSLSCYLLQEWPKGSLEEIVQNAVKSWEMEVSHKTRLKDLKTINHEKFQLIINGNKYKFSCFSLCAPLIHKRHTCECLWQEERGYLKKKQLGLGPCEGWFLLLGHVSQQVWLERGLNFRGYRSWTQNSTQGPKVGPGANGVLSLKKWGPNLPRPKSSEQPQ